MAEDGGSHCCGPGYASPAEAMKSPRETLLYSVALYVGTGVAKPDYLATVDVDPKAPPIRQVVDRLAMPDVGDELHHFGWNACASCHQVRQLRRYLVVPGVVSGRISHRRHRHRPRHPTPAQGDRADEIESQDQAHRAAHRPLPGRRADHDLDARRRERGTRPAASCCSTRISTSPAAGRRTCAA